MIKFSKNIKLVFAGILINLLFVSSTSIFLFGHYHKLPNGELVFHVHPFSKKNYNGPIKHHHHNKVDFIVLSVLNNSSFEKTNPEICINSTDFSFSELIFEIKQDIFSLNFISDRKGRSPPVS